MLNVFGIATVAGFIKLIPWMIGLKVASGFIDIGVHTVKIKISNRIK
jgi:hypothetical protein